MDALFRHRWAGRTGGANERPCSVEKWPELRLAVRLSVVGAASHGVAVLASISAVAARFAEAACASLLGSRGGRIVPSARTREPGTQLRSGSAPVRVRRLGASWRVGFAAGVNCRLTDREPPLSE